MKESASCNNKYYGRSCAILNEKWLLDSKKWRGRSKKKILNFDENLLER